MFCNHSFKSPPTQDINFYGKGSCRVLPGFRGIMNYGRQTLCGNHYCQICEHCGEIRWKSYNWTVVSKRKTLEYPKQLIFR